MAEPELEDPLCKIDKKLKGLQARRDRLVLEVIATDGAIGNLTAFRKSEQDRLSPIAKPNGKLVVVPG